MTDDGKPEPAPAQDPKDPKDAGASQPLRDAWLSVLGVFQTAESEVHKAAGRLIESFGISSADTTPQGLAKELMARMKKNRDEFEKRVEDGVKSAFQKLKEPIDLQVGQLRTRIEELGKKLEDKGRGRMGREKKSKADEPEGKAKSDKPDSKK